FGNISSERRYDKYSPAEKGTNQGERSRELCEREAVACAGANVWTLPQGFPGMKGDRDRLKNATLDFFTGTREFDSGTVIILDTGQHVEGIELTNTFDPAEWKDIK